MSNIQVTDDDNANNNARSESSIVVNPNNPMQIVAGSKKFRDIHNYDFTLATEFSNDGGLSWHDSTNLSMSAVDAISGEIHNFTLLTDPALAWDDSGKVFLVGLPGNNPPKFDALGIVIYKSTDGGQTWGEPLLIHKGTDDDKQWAAGDGNPKSSFHGQVYAVWCDGLPGRALLRFARTTDHGANWIGTGSDPAGSVLANNTFSPEINIAADGTIYIIYLAGSDISEIKMIVSNDGGDNFHQVTSPAKGIKPIESSSLPSIHLWKVFPGATFRLSTVPTACVYGKRWL